MQPHLYEVVSDLLPYRRLMEEQRGEEGVLGMLENRLEQAVHRDEGLFHLLIGEEAFKQVEEVEQFTMRVETLDLAAVRHQWSNRSRPGPGVFSMARSRPGPGICHF